MNTIDQDLFVKEMQWELQQDKIELEAQRASDDEIREQLNYELQSDLYSNEQF